MKDLTANYGNSALDLPLEGETDFAYALRLATRQGRIIERTDEEGFRVYKPAPVN